MNVDFEQQDITIEIPDGQDGNGIKSITLYSTVGRVKTYRITFTDGTHYDYTVEDGAPGPAGNGIASISLLGTSGLQKTYRITFTNGGHYDYVVTDGAQGDPGPAGNGIVSVYKTGTSGLVDTYTILYSNGNTDEFTVTNGAQGQQGPTGPTGNGISSVEKIGTVGLVDTYRINFTNGNHYDYTVTNGQDGADPEWGNITGTLSDQADLKQALDAKADIIHTSASGSLVHITDGAAYPVDSLSVSINPVQDLHGYDAPWPAGGGKNLFDKSQLTESGSTGVSQITDGFVLSAKVDNNAYCGINTYINGDFGGKTVYAKIGSITASAQNIGYCVIAFLDGNDTEIDGSVRINLASNNLTGSVTAPQGTAKIKLSLYATFMQLCNVGDSATYKDVIVSLENVPYSPYSNVCPISGHSSATVTRTGINIWDEESESGYIWNGTSGASDTYKRAKNYIAVKPNTEYRVVGATYDGQVPFYNSNKTYISNHSFSNGFTFTTPSNCYYIKFYNPVANFASGISVNYPSSDTAYHTGNIQTVTIALGSTVYGAQLDAVTGTLTVDRVSVANETWSRQTTAISGKYRFATESTIYKTASTSTDLPKIICSNLKTVSRSDNYTNATQGITIGSDGKITICVDGITTLEDFETWLSANNPQIVAELATPTVITGLTPAQISLLLGENNVWADTGDASIGYRADTKLYIDSKLAAAIAELQALILEH